MTYYSALHYAAKAEKSAKSAEDYSSKAENAANRAENAGLPSQTGNSGKVLITDGTSPFWGELDSSWIAEQAMPSNRYIDLTLGASNSQYTAPANGYFQISKTAGISGAQVNFSTPDNGFGALFYSGASTGSYCKGFLPVKKGQTITIQYSATGATNLFRFIYAEGEI